MSSRSFLPPFFLFSCILIFPFDCVFYAHGSHSNSYADTSGSGQLRRNFPSLHMQASFSKDDKLTPNVPSSLGGPTQTDSKSSAITDDDSLDDFEDPDFLPMDLHDTSKRQYDDYGHLRFGKRNSLSNDYGHMRFGKRNHFDDYGQLRFGKRSHHNTNNDNNEDDYGHLRFGR